MKLTKLTRTIVAALLALPLLGGTASAYELVLPSLDYRTGPYAPNGIPFANGYGDYMQLLNERDGGINGTRISLVAFTGQGHDQSCSNQQKGTCIINIEPSRIKAQELLPAYLSLDGFPGFS